MDGVWHSHAVTDAGRVRGHNEDAVLELGEQRLWCVADGMGGHQDGAHASALAIAALRGYHASPHRGITLARLQGLAVRCNDALLRHARDHALDVVGCTLAVLTLHDGSALVSWCGDARVYRLRRGRLQALTRDHSVGAESDDRDRHVLPEPVEHGRSALTAAIGGAASTRLEHGWFTLDEQDRFLLCTDGLVKDVEEDEILGELRDAASIEAAVAALFARYYRRGAHDNIGVVGVSAGHAGTVRRPR